MECRQANRLEKFGFVDDGDDFGLIMEKEDLQFVQALLFPFFLRRGYEMEIDPPVDRIENIVFCQCSPVYTPTGYCMVRNPYTVMAKDVIKNTRINTQRDWSDFCFSVSQCGLSCFGDIPVLNAYYNFIGKGMSPSSKFTPEINGMYFLSLGMDKRFVEPTIETRISFQRAFGITVERQLAIELFLYNLAPEWKTPQILKNIPYSVELANAQSW
jgi:hypothetical protein